jgi:hypothetical protein
LKQFVVACLFWVIGAAIFYFSFGRLKSVYLDNDALYVSNFLHRITIPLEDVLTVKRTDFWTSKISKVVLTLSSTTSFGRRIEFSPAFSSNEVVKELNDRLQRPVVYPGRSEG